TLPIPPTGINGGLLAGGVAPVTAAGGTHAATSGNRACADTSTPPGRSGESAAFHQPADGGHHLASHLLTTTLLDAGSHAMPCMSVQQAQRDLVQRRLNSADLGQHVDAVTVVIDHPLDAPDLPLDAAQPGLQLRLGGGVPARHRCRHPTNL